MCCFFSFGSNDFLARRSLETRRRCGREISRDPSISNFLRQYFAERVRSNEFLEVLCSNIFIYRNDDTKTKWPAFRLVRTVRRLGRLRVKVHPTRKGRISKTFSICALQGYTSQLYLLIWAYSSSPVFSVSQPVSHASRLTSAQMQKNCKPFLSFARTVLSPPWLPSLPSELPFSPTCQPCDSI